MKKILTLSVAVFLISLNLGFAWVEDKEEKPKYSTKQVMAKFFKGPKALKAKISKGNASEADKKLALEYLEALADNKPKKGAPESWKKKTDALVKAAKDLVAGKPGAVKAINAGSNCKACHNVHK
ncbi:MAG: hypothetical protein VX768_14560 [Planctomycetota bacterium]|nr:hypothetical protein [Planctomycetota bacterium]